MERDLKLTEKIRKYCCKIGADIIGFADVKHFNKFQTYNQPENYLKNSKTVIVLGLHIFDLVLDAWNINPDNGKNYQFADTILEKLCNLTKDFVKELGYETEIISYTPGLFLKDSAALAGIGPIGKNNLLITENFGSQVRLRALVTTAPLICGKPILESKYCKKCELCVKSCPADAFKNGKYNKDICQPFQLIHLRKLSENTSIWCNICIDSCTANKYLKKKDY